MPPDWLAHWAPVVGLLATTGAVLVALDWGIREQFWRRRDRKRAAWHGARCVVARLAVVEGHERSQVRLIAVWNGGAHSITQVRCWVTDSAGNRVMLVDEDRNRVDHLFRALILPKENFARKEVRSEWLPTGDLDSADLVVDWVSAEGVSWVYRPDTDERWPFTRRKAADKKIAALTGATADQLRIAA